MSTKKTDELVQNANIIEREKLKKDGWSNVMTGLGTEQDKSTYTVLQNFKYIDWNTLINIWMSEGLGSRIVSVVADDMLREWLKVENDSENILKKELERLDSLYNFNIAKKWARLLGGSAIILGINDGRDIEEPVNIKAIKNINYLKVFDRTEIEVIPSSINNDPNSLNFGEPEFINVYPAWGNQFKIHTDRVLLFKGEPVPGRFNCDIFYYFGKSILQTIFDSIKGIGSAINSVLAILQEYNIDIFKLNNLETLLSSGQEDLVIQRMKVINRAKSLIQAVILDSNDEFDKKTTNLAGLSDILDKLMMFVSSNAGIPVTRLFERSPAGLNSTGEHDLLNYYDTIKVKQKTDLTKQALKLVKYINAYKKILPEKGDIEIIWNPLFQLSDSEEIKNRQIQSEIDKTYYELNVYDSDEIRQNRFMNGYSYDNNIEGFLDNDNEEIEENTEEDKDGKIFILNNEKNNKKKK